MMGDFPNVFDFPGKKMRSKVWSHFGFYKKNKDGPPVRENLDMDKAVCKLCRKEYAYKGESTIHIYFDCETRDIFWQNLLRKYS